MTCAEPIKRSKIASNKIPKPYGMDEGDCVRIAIHSRQTEYFQMTD